MEIDLILTLCTSIYSLSERVKANKDRCKRVADRVKSLEELVLTIKEKGLWQFSSLVSNALKELHLTLAAAKALIMKFTDTKPVMNVLKSSINEDKFSKINERLSDNLQILSGALQIEQGDTLNKMYNTFSRHSSLEDPQIGFMSPTGRMSQDSGFSPTAPPMPSRPLMSPTTSTGAPMITQAIPVTNPTAAMPVPSVMPPMYPSSTILMPAPSTMPVNNPTIPINFSSPIAPSLLRPMVGPQPYINTIFIPPKSVIASVNQKFTTNTPQMAFSQTNQCVVTTVVVNKYCQP